MHSLRFAFLARARQKRRVSSVHCATCENVPPPPSPALLMEILYVISSSTVSSRPDVSGRCASRKLLECRAAICQPLRRASSACAPSLLSDATQCKIRKRDSTHTPTSHTYSLFSMKAFSEIVNLKI